MTITTITTTIIITYIVKKTEALIRLIEPLAEVSIHMYSPPVKATSNETSKISPTSEVTSRGAACETKSGKEISPIKVVYAVEVSEFPRQT